MKIDMTYNKLKIILSRISLERKRNLAKQMVQENDYLFVLDNDIIFKMIDHLNDEEMIKLFKEFDDIGILCEYVLDIDDNNVNIYNKKYVTFNSVNEKENEGKTETLFIKILTILVVLLLFISYIIFSFHYMVI